MEMGAANDDNADNADVRGRPRRTRLLLSVVAVRGRRHDVKENALAVFLVVVVVAKRNKEDIIKMVLLLVKGAGEGDAFVM